MSDKHFAYENIDGTRKQTRGLISVFLNSMDAFEFPVGLGMQYNGKSTYSTKSGGCLTILAVLFSILLFSGE